MKTKLEAAQHTSYIKLLIMNKTIQTWLLLLPRFYETNSNFRYFIKEDEINKLTNNVYIK